MSPIENCSIKLRLAIAEFIHRKGLLTFHSFWAISSHHQWDMSELSPREPPATFQRRTLRESIDRIGENWGIHHLVFLENHHYYLSNQMATNWTRHFDVFFAKSLQPSTAFESRRKESGFCCSIDRTVELTGRTHRWSSGSVRIRGWFEWQPGAPSNDVYYSLPLLCLSACSVTCSQVHGFLTKELLKSEHFSYSDW